MGDREYFLGGVVLSAAAVVMQFLARNVSGAATWYAHHVYPLLVGVIGGFFGIFSFSLAEKALYLLVCCVVVYVWHFWREPGRILARAVFLAGVLFFSYTCNCGVNYYAASFSEYADVEVGTYSKEELKELCEFLTKRVNETALEERYVDYRWAWRKESVRAMQRAGKRFAVLGGFYPQPKEVRISWILSVQQLCGIYSPFTIEANYNKNMPSYNIPHTMCHELSHLKGFMREDEANFIGYLACVESERQAFRYSGYLTGWVYAGNALAAVDLESYLELHGQLCKQAKEDLRKNNAFWDKYEGKVAEVANQMNDVYLKANDQSDGVQSYGRMVDLMLGYYQKRKEEKE
ncbi:MAG: DUF3810 domain-containing protein [Lachnospiraceae bacterium]|nr:DUF3810 domain-containing protein [Lachnospiraceae bacterium]